MLKYTKTVLVMLALLLAVLGPLLVAAQEDGDDDPIPPPTGPYQVGQTYRHWVDESRDEPYTDEEDDHRELVVMIWYPADVADNMERAQYWESLSGLGEDTWATYFESGQLASLTPFSQEVFDSFPELKTHAVRDAPVAETESTYPVLIFSHGGEGWPELYTYQALELASHGYIVIGINHTFYSSLTVFPDGHVTGFIGFNDAVTVEQVLTTMAQDIIFAIDQVETLNSNDPEGMFTGRFDPDGVGVVGHSLGAAAAVVAGPMDDRILAVINEDGIILPYTYPRVEQPFMYFSAGEPRFEFDGVNYTVIVLEFHHLSFTDLVLFVPGFGSVSPARSVEIARAYVLAFFDEYVKGIEQPLLDGSFDDFPEVDVTINSTD